MPRYLMLISMHMLREGAVVPPPSRTARRAEEEDAQRGLLVYRRHSGTRRFLRLVVCDVFFFGIVIVIGIKEGDASIAGPKAALASRTNTLLSLPMLCFMVSSSHNQLGGNLWAEQITMTAFFVGLGRQLFGNCWWTAICW